MISITSRGEFTNFKRFTEKILRGEIFSELSRFGEEGVNALSKATPVRTGLTAASWQYRIVKDRQGYRIEWYNTNTVMGNTPIVILIQYGHGTRNGGYVAGRDFINPAMRPIFDKIAENVWKKVSS
jgi:hypothetical protein